MTEREQALEEAAVMLEGFAEHDQDTGCPREADALYTAASCVRGLKVPGEMVSCVCLSCPTLVEAWSRSGMCGPCANEDCEHDEDEDSEPGPPGATTVGRR